MWKKCFLTHTYDKSKSQKTHVAFVRFVCKVENMLCITSIKCNICYAFIKSPKQPNKVWETYCFCSVSSYYYYYYSPFFPRTMNLSTADLRNYWTEFHETWWSYRYTFLVGFVVMGVKVIFWGVQREWGLL